MNILDSDKQARERSAMVVSYVSSPIRYLHKYKYPLALMETRGGRISKTIRSTMPTRRT